MWGQWIGTATGSIAGSAMLNIDRNMNEFGSIEIHYTPECEHPIRPISIGIFNIEVTETGFKAEAIPFIDPDTVLPKAKPGQQPTTPKNSKIEGTFDKHKHIVATFDEGVYGKTEFKFYNQEINLPLYGVEMDWEQFKRRVSKLEYTLSNDPKEIYRGHSGNKFCLRTAFHRCDKRSLRSFLDSHLPTLYFHLGPFLNREYNLQDNEDVISLLYLAEHHGFPTPFLDWTESPFVAAYFAYHQLDKYRDYGEDERVRVYAFKQYEWTSTFKNPRTLAHVPPQFSVLKPRVSNHDRALPQQSVVTYSNIVNIDAFIATIPHEGKPPYLVAYDLPARQRNVVICELRQMGITHASLFPGIEGTCRALKERFM